MKRLHTDDPVRVVRTLFREIDDQVINQVFHRGIGRVGVRKSQVKVLGGGFELLNGFSPCIKNTRTWRVHEGGIGGVLE